MPMSRTRKTNGARQSGYAPIGLSVYSRVEHIDLTVRALKNNTLASLSDLYVFSDAPKPGDEEKVAKVRRYLKGIDGFQSVTIVERQENSRVKNNRGGHRELLDRYGRMIWVEEDIVTAPGFLEYMNQALVFYQSDPKIFSITGYCPPLDIPSDLPGDVFVLGRFNAWGFGIWKDRYDRIELNLGKERGLLDLSKDDFLERLMRNGTDIPKMLLKDIQGEIDALDVKIMYQQALNDWQTVYPRKSFVQNIGHDGSGAHCGATGKYSHAELWERANNFIFPGDLVLNSQIVAANYKFRLEINEFSRNKILNDVIGKIKERKINSLSLWGANNFSSLLIPVILENKVKINFIVDKQAECGEFVFEGITVVPISKAIECGEENFILCSTIHNDSMKESLKQVAGDRFDQVNVVELI
jgi:hypothetical protein